MLTLFSSDIYIPALHQLAMDLHGSDVEAQMSVTIAMAGVALGLIVFGSMSDVVGRKKTLMSGISIFMISAIICALAPNMIVLLVARFIGGFGVAAAQVAAASVPFDMYQGAEASKMVSRVVMFVSISPVIAPLIGQAIINAMGWRACFWFLLVFSVAALSLVALKLPESLAAENRVKADVKAIASSYLNIVKNSKTIALLLVGGLTYGIMYIGITNCPYLVKTEWKMGTVAYLVIYAFLSVGTIAGGFLNIMLLDKYGRKGLLKMGAGISMITAAAGFALAFMVHNTLPALVAVTVVAMFIIMALASVVNPNMTGLIVDQHPNAIGAANACVSVGQNIGGSFFAPLAFMAFTNMGGFAHSPLPLSAVVLLSVTIFGVVIFVAAMYGMKEKNAVKSTNFEEA
jgi:DHA1 family bicyclomycin/chloramphenicol resistance-like MFS transporter